MIKKAASKKETTPVNDTMATNAEASNQDIATKAEASSHAAASQLPPEALSAPPPQTPSAAEWLWQLPTDGAGQSDDNAYPADTLGLAISGGGVRSSTFALGFLQAWAGQDLLRRIDFMSTVSGGGYVGTFFGRYFDQLRNIVGPDTQGRHAAHTVVAENMADHRSTPIRWLRQHANYLASTGSNEELFNLATFWRNFLSLHFVLGILFFAIFGLMNGALYWESMEQALRSSRSIVESIAPVGAALTAYTQPTWWMVTEAVVWYFLLPITMGYWLVSQDRQDQVIWPVMCIYGLLAIALTLTLRTALPLGIFTATIFAIVWVARRVQQQIGSANPDSDYRRLLTRHELTQNLGTATVTLIVLFVLGIINSIGHFLAVALLVQELSWTQLFQRVGLLVAPFLAGAPLVRALAGAVASQKSDKSSWLSRLAKVPYLLTTLVVVIGTVLPLSIVAFFSHAAYGNGGNFIGGWMATLLALVISLLLGTRSARPFVNRSGPLALYASRLSRVFLGAVNPIRHRESYGSDVTSLIAGDDVDHDKYKPHEAGGPLHIFNVAVNETVDVASQRGQRDRQGENMAVGPIGLNIARRWHARWVTTQPAKPGQAGLAGQIEVKPIANGTEMHPFLHRLGNQVFVEKLTIRMWMAISGAAISSGAGRLTGAAFSLLVTLGNFRLGYWWDSGLSTINRANCPIRLTLLERVKLKVMRLFTTQGLLVSELRGRFGGPWRRYFYLSDGGHFENSGAYELLRRRLPLIVVIDGGQDRKGQTVGLGELARISRIDFGCELTAMKPSDLAALGVPDEIRGALGTPAELLHNERGLASRHATLLKVTYPTWNGPGPDPWYGRQSSWMLYVRLTMTGDEAMDVVSYQAQNTDFPNQTTLDQDFDEPQFESYRCLGHHIGQKLFP